jgi:hypothetical protein
MMVGDEGPGDSQEEKISAGLEWACEGVERIGEGLGVGEGESEESEVEMGGREGRMNVEVGRKGAGLT